MKSNAAQPALLGLACLLLALAPAAARGQSSTPRDAGPSALRLPGVPRHARGARPKPAASERWLERLNSRADFERLARVYTDQPYALPHVIFVIDRKNKDKIYYVNSQRFRFHKDFVKGTYLSLENAQDFFRNNYLNANRRFILGTLAWQAPVKRYTFEHWEGDLIPAELIKLVAGRINATFF